MRRQILKFRALWIVLPLMFAAGCWKENMGSQPKAKPMQESVFFADGAAARPLVQGTVARGDTELDSHFYQGFINGKPATTFPEQFPTSGAALATQLRHGREQFTIYCAMCHGDAGDGRGIIMQRGFVPPPSYHIDRLRIAPVGHLFDVITNGYGAMYSYGDRISPADRWAIVAYIRTLQMSQAIPAKQLDSTQLREVGDAQ